MCFGEGWLITKQMVFFEAVSYSWPSNFSFSSLTVEVQGLKLSQKRGTHSALPNNLLGGSVSCCIVIKHCFISFGFPSLPVRAEFEWMHKPVKQSTCLANLPTWTSEPAGKASTAPQPLVSCCLLWYCCQKYCETLIPLNGGVQAVFWLCAWRMG